MEHIEDYKTILKSVKIINDKMEDAKSLNVDLDPSVIQEINRCTSRLISERNLRFQMEMTRVIKSEPENVDQLKDLIDKAQENDVS